MKEKSSSSKTAIPSDDFVIRLLDATRKAREWSGRREGPRNTYLGDRGSQIGLWGEDAGADYIETHWPDLEKILLAYAESRNAEGSLTTPVLMRHRISLSVAKVRSKSHEVRSPLSG